MHTMHNFINNHDKQMYFQNQRHSIVEIFTICLFRNRLQRTQFNKSKPCALSICLLVCQNPNKQNRRIYQIINLGVQAINFRCNLIYCKINLHAESHTIHLQTKSCWLTIFFEAWHYGHSVSFEKCMFSFLFKHFRCAAEEKQITSNIYLHPIDDKSVALHGIFFNTENWISW